MNTLNEFRQSKINWKVLKRVFLQGEKSQIYPPQPYPGIRASLLNMFSLQQLSEIIKPIIEEINSIYEAKIYQLMIMKNIELQVLDKKISILEEEISLLKNQKIYDGYRIIKNKSSKGQTKIDEQQHQNKSFIYIQQNQNEEEQSLLQPQTQQKRPIIASSNNKTINHKQRNISNNFNNNQRKLFHHSSQRFQEKDNLEKFSQPIPQSARFFEEQTKMLKQELTGLRIAIEQIHNVKVLHNQQTRQSLITYPQPASKNILNFSSNNKVQHLINQNRHLRDKNDSLLMKLLQVQQQLQNIRYILIESLNQDDQLSQQ